MKLVRLALLSSLVAPVFGATYTIADSVAGSEFLNFFDFEVIPDPAGGRVYVTGSVACRM